MGPTPPSFTFLKNYIFTFMILFCIIIAAVGRPLLRYYMRDSAITPLPLTPPQLPPTVPVRGLDPLSLHTADTKDPHKVRDLLVGHGLLKKTATGGYNSTVESTVTEKIDEKLEEYSTTRETDTKLETKVDKVDGKGLSSTDFTNEEKKKLQGIEAGAQKNPNLAPYAKTATVNMALENKVSRTDDNTETMGRAVSAPTDFTNQVTFTSQVDFTAERPRMNNMGMFSAYVNNWDYGIEFFLTAYTSIPIYDESFTHTGEYLELGEIFTDEAIQAISTASGYGDSSSDFMYFEPYLVNLSLGQYNELTVMLWDNETEDYTKEWSRKVTTDFAYATVFTRYEYGQKSYSLTFPLYTTDTAEYVGDLSMVDLSYDFGTYMPGRLDGFINFSYGMIDMNSSGFVDPELEASMYDMKLRLPEQIEFYASTNPDPNDYYGGHISPVNTGEFRTATDAIDASEIKSGELALERLPTIPESKLSSLSAGKITSGTFNAARIPSLPADKITSGVFPYSVLPQEIKVKRRLFSDSVTTLLRSNVVGTFTDSKDPTAMRTRWCIAGLTHGGRATILVSRASHNAMASMKTPTAIYRPTLRNLLKVGNATIHFVGDPVTLDADPMPAGVYEIFGFGNSTLITPPEPTYDMDLTGYEFIIRFTALPLE